jgi:hypothetical protein
MTDVTQMPAPVGEAAIAWAERCATRDQMWVRVRAEYEFGQLSVAAISRLTKLWDPEEKGVSGTAITKRASRGEWLRPTAGASIEMIRARMKELGITDHEVIGDAGLLANAAAMTAPPVADVSDLERQKQLDAALARTVAIVRDHRSSLAKMRAIGDALADKIHEAVVNGHATIKIYTEGSGRNAQEVETLDFLGPRESVSDAFQKTAQALSRVIPMERTAYGLNDDSQNNKPPLVIKIGTMFGQRFHQKPAQKPAIDMEPDP